MSAGNGSGERILAILDVFSEDQLEWTSEMLMAELGYSRPTLYRYLKILKDAGLLVSLPSRGFTLGPRVVELDFLMRKSDVLVAEAQCHLEELSHLYPCSALLVRWYGNKLLCVASACSIANPLSSYPRGRPMPLARGAISRAILAFLPRRRQVPLIEANIPEFTAIGQGETTKEVIDNLKRVRAQGVAIAYGEVTPGVIGVAAPVFDAGRAPVAALCITIAQTSVGPGLLAEITKSVTTAAASVSAALSDHRAGGQGDKNSANPPDQPSHAMHGATSQ